MKTTMELSIPKDCYILCRLFHCRIEDVLLYYMKQINMERIQAKNPDKMMITATAFLLYSAEKERKVSQCPAPRPRVA